MADKKLSSVSAVSDMNFVYAETSTGETVKISKADLASVVAELMGFSKALRIVGDITTGDANNLNTGLYFYNANIGALANKPGGNFGFIICIANTSMKLQIGGWAGGDSALKCRNWYSGGTWSAWRDL